MLDLLHAAEINRNLAEKAVANLFLVFSILGRQMFEGLGLYSLCLLLQAEQWQRFIQEDTEKWKGGRYPEHLLQYGRECIFYFCIPLRG